MVSYSVRGLINSQNIINLYFLKPVSKTIDDGVKYTLVSTDAQFVDPTALTVKFDTAGKRK